MGKGKKRETFFLRIYRRERERNYEKEDNYVLSSRYLLIPIFKARFRKKTCIIYVFCLMVVGM